MNDMKKISLFLIDREERVDHQEKLLKKYKGRSLATVRINYPGLEKSNFITDSIVKVISEDILNFYKSLIIYKEEYKNREGYIVHFIFSADEIIIKKAMIALEENHILGRCVDIDVYCMGENVNGLGDKIICSSRSDFKLSPRKCFLCDEEARLCSRGGSHSYEEIKEYFENKFRNYLTYEEEKRSKAYDISQLALKAIIEEVSTMPSFGLVSPCSNGAHKDMNFYTFMDSSFAIGPYLKDMANLAYSYHEPKEIFEAIRFIGKDCEEAMYDATKGVNTHKGMIFLVGIVVAATMKTLYEEKSFHHIKVVLKDMCENLLDDFKDLDKKSCLTHGEKLFEKYGFTGIRGQVVGGLTIIFQEILPAYEKSNLRGNYLYAQTLLELMAKVEDSTIAYRHDLQKLQEIQNKSKKILAMGGFYSIEGIKEATKFEKQCIEENISPGGGADLLAVVIFLAHVHKKFF